MACTALQGPHPYLRATFPLFSRNPKMRRREPPCAVAPNLCPAESKCRLNSFRCAWLRVAAIRPPAVALLATPRAGAIRVLFTRLGPPHGSPVEARCVSRTSRVNKFNTFLPVAPPTGAPGTRRGALACARCTFVLRMVLSPQRGAHFPYLRGHEHHLGSAKLSSRLRAVRILKNELSPARGAHFHAHL